MEVYRSVLETLSPHLHVSGSDVWGSHNQLTSSENGALSLDRGGEGIFFKNNAFIHSYSINNGEKYNNDS